MAITKHKITFDPAAGDDYDVVASFLKAADGTLITHTAGALDVNIDNASIAVTATDLDIRDLAFATDTVDASGSEVSLDAATLAALESITVSATDLDIRDLDSAQDSVEIKTAAGQALDIEADGSINVNSSEAGYSSCVNATKAVAATATDLVTTELALRKEITIQNVGSKDVYIGCDNSVTTSNGLLVPKGATASFRLGPAINVHAIGDGGTSEVRILELA